MSSSNSTRHTHLAGIVGQANVLGRADLDGRDPGFHPHNLAADLAVLPRSAHEVAAILAFCNRNRIGVVPQGGRTGLSGGASSSSGQILLCTDRLSAIERLDPSARLAIVEPGVTLAALATAVSRHGLSVGIDLGARGTATIGGMISTNAGGMQAFRHGSMRQRILGLEVVLPDGTIVDAMTEISKCNEGYDVKQLFCGAEGTLGVITKAALQLVPEVRATSALFVACAGAAAAIDIMRRFEASSEVDLVHAEIMWSGYADRVARALNLERMVPICQSDVCALFDLVPRMPHIDPIEVATECLTKPGLTELVDDAVIAKSERERQEFWSVRENSFVIDDGLAHSLWFDISVPLTHLDAYVTSVDRAIGAVNPAIEIYVMGHLGDGNLHYTIGSQGQLSAHELDAVTHAVYGELPAIGGSFSAEHGIGTEKRDCLQAFSDPGKLKLMQQIKQLIDPRGIMNPGKVV